MDSLVERLLVDFGPHGIIIIAILLAWIFQNNKLNRILIALERKVPFEWIEKELPKYQTTKTCDALMKDKDG